MWFPCAGEKMIGSPTSEKCLRGCYCVILPDRVCVPSLPQQLSSSDSRTSPTKQPTGLQAKCGQGFGPAAIVHALSGAGPDLRGFQYALGYVEN